MEQLKLKFWLCSVTLPAPLHIPVIYRDVPPKIERVIPEHPNVHYVHFNKINWWIRKMVQARATEFDQLKLSGLH